MDLATRRIPDTETTVLSFIKEHSPYLKNFESMAELQDSATDINTSGKNVAFMYTKDPEKFSLEIPLPCYQYPLQVQKLETEVPCETRTAGLILYYPLFYLVVWDAIFFSFIPYAYYYTSYCMIVNNKIKKIELFLVQYFYNLFNN